MKKSILIIYLILVLIFISIYSLFDYIIDYIIPFIHLTLPTSIYKLIKSILPIVIGFFISYFIFKLKNPNVKKMSFNIKRFIIFGIVPLFSLVIYLTSIHHIISEKFFENIEILSVSIKYIFDKYEIWSCWLGFALGASFEKT